LPLHAALSKGAQLQMRTSGIVELFPDAGYGAIHAILDHLSAGVVLLDRKLNVLFANKAFHAIAKDGVLSLRGRTLSSSLPPYARKLDRMARTSLLGVPGGTMAIPHPDDGRLITIMVSSVHSRGLDTFVDLQFPHSAAIVFVFDPAGPSELPLEWIMDAYQLTMAEAQVASQASFGRPVSEISIRLHISPNTVKTHLRRIFSKTGVRGQAELAALISALRSVRGDVEA
jgi:DNA-binding CsgD family transcriptional regulator